MLNHSSPGSSDGMNSLGRCKLAIAIAINTLSSNQF